MDEWYINIYNSCIHVGTSVYTIMLQNFVCTFANFVSAYSIANRRRLMGVAHSGYNYNKGSHQ